MSPNLDQRDWHATFRQWAQPPSETEDQKASNAERMIRDAIRRSPKLANRNIGVYATGSYRNSTNTRTDSDVDIAVVLNEVFFYDQLPEGITPEIAEFNPSNESFDAFRADVGAALRAKFRSGVTDGRKAFDVHENSYRLDADVAAFFQHRRYTSRREGDGRCLFHEGVEMKVQGSGIVNWHQQHYDEGVAKNTATGKRFKRVTRIIKRLRSEMADAPDVSAGRAATPISSFLIECMVHNVPDDTFNRSAETYFEDVKQVIGWLWTRLDKAEHTKFTEVSGLKWLFRPTQRWTDTQAKDFLYSAWNYVGFGNR